MGGGKEAQRRLDNREEAVLKKKKYVNHLRVGGRKGIRRKKKG